MRACEGCRRRKIKCDAATTNSWPCSACVRLKLTCLPPQLQYAGEFAAQTQVILDSGEGVPEYDGHGGGEDDYGAMGPKTYRGPPGGTAYRNVPLDHHGAAIAFQHPMSQAGGLESPMQPMQQQYPHVADYHQPWTPEPAIPTAASVAGVLGQLKIEDSGVGEFIMNMEPQCDMMLTGTQHPISQRKVQTWRKLPPTSHGKNSRRTHPLCQHNTILLSKYHQRRCPPIRKPWNSLQSTSNMFIPTSQW
jgi:hypothetical protein